MRLGFGSAFRSAFTRRPCRQTQPARPRERSRLFDQPRGASRLDANLPRHRPRQLVDHAEMPLGAGLADVLCVHVSGDVALPAVSARPQGAVAEPFRTLDRLPHLIRGHPRHMDNAAEMTRGCVRGPATRRRASRRTLPPRCASRPRRPRHRATSRRHCRSDPHLRVLHAVRDLPSQQSLNDARMIAPGPTRVGCDSCSPCCS